VFADDPGPSAVAFPVRVTCAGRSPSAVCSPLVACPPPVASAVPRRDRDPRRRVILYSFDLGRGGVAPRGGCRGKCPIPRDNPARRPRHRRRVDCQRRRAAFENTRKDTELFAEQGWRWQAAAADPATRAAVDGYLTLAAQQRALVDEVLAVADELAAGTIDTVLATSDLERGLEALFGRRPPRP
jgi:hypothetical protein